MDYSPQTGLARLYAQASRQAALRREADGLPVCLGRWHIDLTPSGPKSWVHRLASNEWGDGPSLAVATLAEADQTAVALRAAAALAKTPPEYLETVVHVADEFVYNQQRSDLPPAIRDNPNVRQALLHADPVRIIADDIRAVLATHSWMDVPGPADGRIALRLARARWTAVRQAYERLCQSGLYRLTVTHAAVETLSASTRLAPRSGEKPFLHFLCFSTYAVLAAVSASGAVVLLRRVELAAGEPARDIARQLDDAVAASGLGRPGLVLVPMGELPAQKILERIVASHGSQPPHYDKESLVTLSPTAVNERLQQSGATGSLNHLGPHHLYWTSAFGQSSEMKEYSQPGFFCRTSAENDAIFPVNLERLPRLINGIRPLLVAVAVALIAWTVWTGAQAVRDPAWKVRQTERDRSEQALRAAENRLTNAEQNQRRMAARGGAALAGWLIQTLFPEGSGVTLEKVTYDFAPALATDAGGQPQIGGVLTWVFRGRARGDGLKKVEAVAADSGVVFSAMRTASEAFGLRSLCPPSSADVKVLSSVQRGTGTSGETLFELRVERRVDGRSDLAFPAPRKEKP